MIFRIPILWGWVLCASEDIFNDEECRTGGDECYLSLRQLRGERSQAEIRQHSQLRDVDYPLAKDDEAAQSWPMTEAASGFCAYPSERSDPRFGAERLGATPEDASEVCEMARKYEGHMAEIGTECATEDTCGKCNGVWCKGTVTAFAQKQSVNTRIKQTESDNPPPFPSEHENETLQTWPMTDAADGFCAYPSERSDPTLGAEHLGAAPTSPEEVEKVCEMARKYEGHRAEVGSECAKEFACSGCNGVWCKGVMKS